MSADRICGCQCRYKTILQLKFHSMQKKNSRRNDWIKEDYCDNHSNISTILSVIKDWFNSLYNSV